MKSPWSLFAGSLLPICLLLLNGCGQETDTASVEQEDRHTAYRVDAESDPAAAPSVEEPLGEAPALDAEPNAVAAVDTGNRPLQDKELQQPAADGAFVMPVQENLVRIATESPQEVRVGESYEYTIRVQNVAEQMILHDVKIVQQTPKGFEIESAEPKPDDAQQQGASHWTIARLQPGEEKTIKVTAASDNEGMAKACIAVTYTPAVCLATEFVKPEIQVVKRGPSEAALCETIVYEYEVTNTGSGATKDMELIDALPEGLQTAKGQQEVKFPISSLEAGESRKFEAELVALKAGEFSSRAVITQPDGSKTRSQKLATNVMQADLQVTLDGPQAEYIDRPLSYTATVTNKGKAPAVDARLTLDPGTGRISWSGDPRREGETAGTPTPSEAKSVEPQADTEGPARVWNLGTVQPGETVKVNYTMVGREAGELEQKAVATYVCGIDNVDTTSTALASTRVISLPALLVAVVDEKDPIAKGSEFTYDIVVKNQGTAPDQNIQLEAELPEGISFVSAEGPSDVTSEGQTVTISKIDTIEPGAELVWQVRVKAEAEGDKQLHVQLSADSLDEPVTASEPTQLFNAEQ